ncbi:hypothetical protein KY314_05180 [Candidatus Woesearchaeota archaeon]|nr:hypothetical protein [Candidatus Woesearchaeota archaeon]
MAKKKKRKKAKKRTVKRRKKPTAYKPSTVRLTPATKQPIKKSNFAVIAALIVIVLAILLIYYGYRTMTGGVAAGVGSSVLSMPPLSTGVVMVVAAIALVAVILLAGKKQ